MLLVSTNLVYTSVYVIKYAGQVIQPLPAYQDHFFN